MTKIAIIEDDPVISQMYRMKFESDGFDVGVATNGLDGLKLVQSVAPDMVLLDIRMPGLDGPETLAKMRQTDWGKHVPVIILTNVGKEEAPDSLKKLGVQSYIVKADLTPRQVVEKVKEALQIQ